MDIAKKLHQLSIHALNACAVLTLISLALNILSAICLYVLDHRKEKV